MSNTKRYLAADEFIVRRIAGDALLVPIGGRTRSFNGMVQLNDVGLSIWNAIGSPRSLSELVDIVSQQYETQDADIKADIMEFLSVGIDNGIITVQDIAETDTTISDDPEVNHSQQEEIL